MLAEQRRTRLANCIRERRFVSLPELAELFGVSESTVRRDLELLEEQGVTKRIHGGALYTGGSPSLPHFEASGTGAWSEKRAIAAKAAARIQEGDSVIFDGGSTTYEVARLLVGKRLHVVTTSLPVANLFATDTNCDLIFVGGNICPRSGVARGPLADQTLDAIRVRRAVLSIAGATDEGYFNNDLLLVETERRMMAAADDVMIVADSSKWGHGSLAHVCPLDQANAVVVDGGLQNQWRDKIKNAGIELLLA